MNNFIVIYTTFSTLKEANIISKELLNEKLIICVNIIPKVNSLYLWEGKINSTCEVITIMKSKNNKFDEIIKKIEAMHSYKEPAIFVIPIKKVNKLFSNWVNNVID